MITRQRFYFFNIGIFYVIFFVGCRDTNLHKAGAYLGLFNYH